MSKKTVANFIVIENTALNSTNFLIRLQASFTLPDVHPGQFVNIEVKGTNEIFLRRPFSIFEVDEKKQYSIDNSKDFRTWIAKTHRIKDRRTG